MSDIGYGIANTQARPTGLQFVGITQDNARQPEITRYAEELEKLLQGCVCAVEGLETRVSSVSRSDPPQPAGTAAECKLTAGPQTTHGQRLASMCDVARMVQSRIDGMARRLEV